VAAAQVRNRQSLPAVEYASRSPAVSPTTRKRLLSDDHDGHKEADESAASHPAERRRRFTAAASIALRKSIDGPQHAENEEVSLKRLQSLLTKTSAANVRAVVERFDLCACWSLVLCCASSGYYYYYLHSVFWHWWFDARKNVWPVKISSFPWRHLGDAVAEYVWYLVRSAFWYSVTLIEVSFCLQSLL